MNTLQLQEKPKRKTKSKTKVKRNKSDPKDSDINFHQWAEVTILESPRPKKKSKSKKKKQNDDLLEGGEEEKTSAFQRKPRFQASSLELSGAKNHKDRQKANKKLNSNLIDSVSNDRMKIFQEVIDQHGKHKSQAVDQDMTEED